MASSSSITVSPPITPRLGEDCERCLRRLENKDNQTKSEKILSGLFMKQVLSLDEISKTSPETLKALAIHAIFLDVTPQTELERETYVRNIRNIYTELKQKKTELNQEEKTCIKEFLRCNFESREARKSFFLTGMREIKLYDKDSYHPKVDLKEAPALLYHHPIQWLFRVLNPHIDLSELEQRKEFIHPHILILGYKSCTTTKGLLDNIYISLTDSSFSSSEKIKHALRMIDLLVVWLSSRYHNHELGQESILFRFRKIISCLASIPHENVKIELGILATLLENSRVITPRLQSDCNAPIPIENLIKKILKANSRESLEIVCKEFVDEITAYFMEYIVEIPLEEFFGDLSDMEKTPRLLNLKNGIVALENWMCYKFSAVSKRQKLLRALICSMSTAYKQNEYQTAFSLKIVYDHLTQNKHRSRLSSISERDLVKIQSLFDVSGNFKELRECYVSNEKHGVMFFPIIPLLAKDLSMLPEIPATVLHQEGFKIYNISRLNLFYKTISPMVHLMKMAAQYVPKTDLQSKISLESLSVESYLSTFPSPRTSK